VNAGLINGRKEEVKQTTQNKTNIFENKAKKPKNDYQ